MDIGRSSQICIRDKIRSIKQKHSPQGDNPVGLRSSDDSYLNSYIVCNLQRSISARRAKSKNAEPKISAIARL